MKKILPEIPYPVKAILFDLDGTLLDTLEDIVNSMNQVLIFHGFPSHPIEEYKTMVGMGMQRLVEKAVASQNVSEAEINHLVKEMRLEYQQHWNDQTTVYEGIPELLDFLRKQPLKMAIITNKPHDFAVRTVRTFLPDWDLDTVRGFVDSTPGKPDPTSTLEIAEIFDVDPEDCLFVGDTSVDMLTARSAGMVPIGALWGFRDKKELLDHGARIVLSQPTDLIPILQPS